MDNNIGVYVDITSIHKNVRYVHQAKLDYKAYLDRISQEGKIYRAFAYGAKIKDEASKFINCLRLFGFEVKYVIAKKENPNNIIKNVSKIFKLKDDHHIIATLKKLQSDIIDDQLYSIYQTDRTIDLIIDIMRIIHKLDTVVIGSSNINILPAIEFIKEKGIKVIIFSANIPYALKNAANTYWEINEDYLELEPEEVDENAVSTQ